MKANIPMSDAGVPCLQEHEHWANCTMQLERQRSFLEELAVFEREALHRYKERQRIQQNPKVENAKADAKSALKGLSLIHI